MHTTFKLAITKVNELLFEGEAISVNLPGTEGDFTVLAHHEPLISLLKEGSINVKTATGTEQFEIVRGLCEVHKNMVTILV